MPPTRPKKEISLPPQDELVSSFRRRTSRPPPPPTAELRSFELMLEGFVRDALGKNKVAGGENGNEDGAR